MRSNASLTSRPLPSLHLIHPLPHYPFMTRTERAAFPRALMRDRSESKSGLDKSLRKGGSGHHNWGSILDEGYLETAAVEDEQQALATEQDRSDSRALIAALVAPSLTSSPQSTSTRPREDPPPSPKRRRAPREASGRSLSRAKVTSILRTNGLLLTTACRH